MVRALEGQLLRCSDPAMKQFVLSLDEERTKAQNLPSFVMQNLDETHLLVDPASVTLIQKKMEELQESNTFSRDDKQPTVVEKRPRTK